MFENPEIPLDDLPSMDNLQWQKLDARYVRRLQIEALIVTALIAAGVLVAQWLPLPVDRRVFIGSWLLVISSGLFSIAWPLLAVPRKGYAIRDKDVVYRSGVFWRTLTAVPFNRVQHVETTSTPLDRRFSQASLQLFTAGSSGGDLKIDGMPAGVAESLRVYILEQAGATIEQP
jgi:hypothetical protein